MLKKSLISLSLICYLAVSSMAAVHAFPSLESAPESNNTSLNDPSLASNEQAMQVNCHQGISQQPDSSKVSACELFCASMGTALATDITYYVDMVMLPSEISTFENGFNTHQGGVEPHPPK